MSLLLLFAISLRRGNDPICSDSSSDEILEKDEVIHYLTLLLLFLGRWIGRKSMT